MGNPIYSCTAMMVPQIPVPPDPIQQMAATQQALINQQALLMVRTPSSLSFFSGNKIYWGLSHPSSLCSVQAQQMTMHAMNLSQQQTQEQQKKEGGKKTEEEKYQRRRSERRSRGRSRSPSPRAPSPKSDRHKTHKKLSTYRKSDSEVLLCMMG